MPARAPAKYPWRAWTATEDNYIRKHFAAEGSKPIAAHLNRTFSAVQHRAIRLDVVGNKRRWNSFEINYLKSRFGRIKTQTIARTLKRTHEAVTVKIVQLKIGPRTMKVWTPQETTYLREHYHKILAVTIAKTLNRTVSSVEAKAELEGLRHRHPRLTAQGEKRVLQLLGTMTYLGLARKFKVNVSTIRRLARKSGYDNGFVRKEWTAEEDALMHELYGNVSRKELAARLGRPIPSVSSRAKTLKLTKPRTLRNKPGTTIR